MINNFLAIVRFIIMYKSWKLCTFQLEMLKKFHKEKKNLSEKYSVNNQSTGNPNMSSDDFLDWEKEGKAVINDVKSHVKTIEISKLFTGESWSLSKKYPI